MVLSGELVIDGYILQDCVVSVFFGDKSPLVTVAGNDLLKRYYGHLF